MIYLLLLARIFLGSVFVYSGWGKLLAPVENFQATIGGYQLIPQVLIIPIALIAPWCEFIFGSFLVLGFMIRISASVLMIFLVTFVILLSRSLLLHLPISECGCFGSGIILAPWQALALDSGLLILSLVVLKKNARLLSLDRRLTR